MYEEQVSALTLHNIQLHLIDSEAWGDGDPTLLLFLLYWPSYMRQPSTKAIAKQSSSVSFTLISVVRNLINFNQQHAAIGISGILLLILILSLVQSFWH